MTKTNFEKKFLSECEEAMKELLNQQEKYNLDKSTMLTYGSGFICGYLTTSMKIDNILKFDDENDEL